MKKKRMACLCCLFLLGIYFINLGFAKAAPNSITITAGDYVNGGAQGYLPMPDANGGPLGGKWMKLSYEDMPLYCVDNTLNWPINGMAYNHDSDSDDKGLVYILEKNYSDIVQNDDDKARYVKQGAVWLYINNGSLGTDFENAADPNNVKQKMIDLYNEAVQVKNGTVSYANTVKTSISFGSTAPTMSLSGDNYVSSVITPTVTKATNYTVSATGADGIKITDNDGSEMSTFASGSGFKVSVPASSVTDTTSINITVSASGTVSYVKYYRPDASVSESNTYQRMIMVDQKESNASANLTISLAQQKVCVNYVIVGDVKPDPTLTDPTPASSCYTKGDNYSQENELTTKTNCTFKGWNLTKDLTGNWVDGTALDDDLTLYGAWDCPTVRVPKTAAGAPLIILGTGLVSISCGTMFYLLKNKKKNE